MRRERKGNFVGDRNHAAVNLNSCIIYNQRENHTARKQAYYPTAASHQDYRGDDTQINQKPNTSYLKLKPKSTSWKSRSTVALHVILKGINNYYGN